MAVDRSHFTRQRTARVVSPSSSLPSSHRQQSSFHRRSTRRDFRQPVSLPPEPEGPVSTADKCRHFLRTVVAFIFSHVGLIVLVICYAIGGALLFQAIEGPHEDKESSVKAFSIARNMTLDDLWNITSSLNVFNQTLFMIEIEERLAEFQGNLVRRIREDGYDGTLSSQWTFSGSFLFALTVITTIGYGNIAPRTDEGKIATILYAIFGIPLMLLYLTNVGGILAQAFRFVYGRFCICSKSHRLTVLEQQRSQRLMRSQSVRFNRQRSSGGIGNRPAFSTPASPVASRERVVTLGNLHSPLATLGASTARGIFSPQLQQPSPLYFPSPFSSPLPPHPDTLWTAGGQSPFATLPAHQHPQSGVQQIPGSPFNVDSLPLTDSYGVPSTESTLTSPPTFPHHEYHPWFTPSSPYTPYTPSPPAHLPHSNVFETRSPSARQAFVSTAAAAAAVLAPSTAKTLALTSAEKVHVPISLCLMILTTYVSGGGLLFSIWEADWGYLEGSYFCFISLSTIGFGDLVPGNAVVSGQGGSQERLIICSLYLLVGLALIVMCFNLMQEEVIHKIRNCGRNIGIIRDPDMEEDDDAVADEDDGEEESPMNVISDIYLQPLPMAQSPLPYVT